MPLMCEPPDPRSNGVETEMRSSGQIQVLQLPVHWLDTLLHLACESTRHTSVSRQRNGSVTLPAGYSVRHGSIAISNRSHVDLR